MSSPVENLSDVTAVILAGGMGTRLRSVVADRPKVLANVGGRPFLAYLLEQTVAIGVRHAVLCTGYLGDQVKMAFGSAYQGMRLLYSQEAVPLGTAGALHLALPLINSDPVLVMNGDSIYQTDLLLFWHWHQAHNAKASLLLTQMPDTQRYGRVQINEEGAVGRFDEKGMPGAGWINAGIYLVSRSLIEMIPGASAVSLEREVFPLWIGRGLYGCQSKGQFLDIGTPESYNDVVRLLPYG